MKTFTLEWNAVVALGEERDVAKEIRDLVALHGTRIDLGIVTTAASENTKERKLPATATDFDERLRAVGLEGLTRVLTVGVYGLTYWNYSIWADESWDEVDIELWETVKPVTISRDHCQFAKENGISDDAPIGGEAFYKWRNKWCDVNSLHAHILAERDVFVSGDVKNFRGEKAGRLKALGVGDILSYAEALELARSI